MNSFFRVFRGGWGLPGVLPGMLRTPVCLLLFLWVSLRFSLGKPVLWSIYALLQKCVWTSASHSVRDVHKQLVSPCCWISHYKTSNSFWLLVRLSRAEQFCKSHHAPSYDKMSVHLSSILWETKIPTAGVTAAVKPCFSHGWAPVHLHVLRVTLLARWVRL